MRSRTVRLARQSLRLRLRDYAGPGLYFVTIVTHARQPRFGEIAAGRVRLTGLGRVVEEEWWALPARFSGVRLDEFVVMPDHVHGLIALNGTGVDAGRIDRSASDPGCVRPRRTEPGSLGRVIQAFKSITSCRHIVGVYEGRWPAFSGRLWQRNYYDAIVRTPRSLERIRRYIRTNPAAWSPRPEPP